MGWIAVDLDGTLAEYDGWKGSAHIGNPVPKMVEKNTGEFVGYSTRGTV